MDNTQTEKQSCTFFTIKHRWSVRNLSAWHLNAYSNAAMVSRLLRRLVKAWEKPSFWQRSVGCNRKKGTYCSFIEKSILCSRPAPIPPTTRIMFLCWCHIDYADRKQPLFVPRSLPSVIHLRGGTGVTLKAIFSMFSAFFSWCRR